MANDLSWVPETIKNVLSRSESHYRAIGYKRTAHHMRQALAELDKAGITPDFYQKYVKLLKEDSREFFTRLNLGEYVTAGFVQSIYNSIDLVNNMLLALDAGAKTPTFNGVTSKPEHNDAISKYFADNGGLFDPMVNSQNSVEVLTKVEPFYDIVYEHVFMPGRDFISTQLEIALGKEEADKFAETVLSIYGTIPKNKVPFSDFRYAQENPGNFTRDKTEWRLNKDLKMPMLSFARWPIFMYYKVPIITAMLPVHNVIFFALVQSTIAKKQGLQ